MSKKECLDILDACKNTLQVKYGILSLRLFGSTARDEQNADSDVDVFVETETANPFLLVEARDFLEASMGRSVDIIRNHRNLNPRLRKRIERDGITVF
ncbi:MAG: nucleotidyltransferase domain-containing protein [Prevotella sp.]|nr:nucleotidyltransferase domain-containing protein [Prevotella sp.]